MAHRRRQPENPHGRMKTCRTARNVPCFRHKNRATTFLRVTAKKIQSAEQALFFNHLKKKDKTPILLLSWKREKIFCAFFCNAAFSA
jgi:hypothetical protein